jgi:microsomal dipeptidase-like Zn-dependent dipeptidase
VNDSEVFYTYLTELGPERVLYGSDNLPVGALRGRCVGFGYDWAFVTEDKCPLPPLPFGPIQPSLVLYEELRAIRRAALRADLSRSSIERIFHTNAERILHEAGP